MKDLLEDEDAELGDLEGAQEAWQDIVATLNEEEGDIPPEAKNAIRDWELDTATTAMEELGEEVDGLEERIPEKHKHQHFLHSLINEKRLRQWFGRVDRKEDQDGEEEWESKRQLMRKLAVIRGDPKTGDVASWINVIPCEALGTKINSPTYLAMLRWWSGASAWQRGKCKMKSLTGKVCGKHLDRFGDHAPRALE